MCWGKEVLISILQIWKLSWEPNGLFITPKLVNNKMQTGDKNFHYQISLIFTKIIHHYPYLIISLTFQIIILIILNEKNNFLLANKVIYRWGIWNQRYYANKCNKWRFLVQFNTVKTSRNLAQWPDKKRKFKRTVKHIKSWLSKMWMGLWSH